jgi:hypothetical protein
MRTSGDPIVAILEDLVASSDPVTAPPPISGSELVLLREVAGMAAPVFVVLNNADQLERTELEEAASLRPRSWRKRSANLRSCGSASSRQALRAIAREVYRLMNNHASPVTATLPLTA